MLLRIRLRLIPALSTLHPRCSDAAGNGRRLSMAPERARSDHTRNRREVGRHRIFHLYQRSRPCWRLGWEHSNRSQHLLHMPASLSGRSSHKACIRLAGPFLQTLRWFLRRQTVLPHHRRSISATTSAARLRRVHPRLMASYKLFPASPTWPGPLDLEETRLRNGVRLTGFVARHARLPHSDARAHSPTILAHVVHLRRSPRALAT